MSTAHPYPHLSNASWIGDRISCAADAVLVNDPESREIYVDPYFGHNWSWTPKPGAALYGRTRDFPAAPIEKRGNGTWLRAPHRRIPVIDVHSLTDLKAIAASARSGDGAIRGVWRGQAKQYFLPRSDEDKLRLYGDVDAKEPSLMPSASRESTQFPSIFEAWSGLLDLYVEARACKFGLPRDAAERVRASYNYRLWGLATAQHYGLPSTGIDISSDVDVALFFALHRFMIDRATGVLTVARTDASTEPVIYGLGVSEGDLLDDADLSPPWLQCSRPKAQKAMFSTAWGSAGNKAAERIYVALRLVDHPTWDSPLTIKHLFPSGTDDSFVEHLLSLRSRISDPVLTDLLSRIYFAP
jgi:hypothetical protein